MIFTEERKQREQILELNHLIAKQVMEKTRQSVGNALKTKLDQNMHSKKEVFFQKNPIKEIGILPGLKTSTLF